MAPVSTEQHKSLIVLAIAAHRRGLKTPEQVAEALQAIITANESYLSKPTRQGASAERFNAVLRERNEVIASAAILLESGTDTNLDWLRRWTEHVARYTAMRIASGQVCDLTEIIETLPPLPGQEG